MPEAANIAQQLETTILHTLNEIISRLPHILGGILLFIFGWLIARLVRSLTLKLMKLFNRFMDRMLSGTSRQVAQFSSRVSKLLAEILFWIILFVFTIAALHSAGFSSIATWLERIFDFLPAILTGSLIMLLGYVLAALVKGVVFVAAQSAQLAEAELLSRLAQAITLVTATVVGLDQVGVNVTFITIMLGVGTAALLSGFALAFGIGARDLVSNLIAAHYLRDLLEPGQKLRLGEHEGTLLELSPTTIILETREGRISLPAKFYHEQAVVLLMEEQADA